MALLRRTRWLALAMLAACGVGGAPGGGTDHLPSAGAGPYAKPEASPLTPAEEPYVIVDARADLRDPAALVSPAGGFDLWFTHAPADGGAVEIWYAHLPSVSDKPDVGPELALAAADAWEAGSVESPSVVDEGDGRLVMYYQGGGDAAPAIGRARSVDGGRTWTRDGQVLADGADPSAVVVEAHTYLYFERGDAAGGGIGVAEADGPDGAFVASPEPVLEPSEGDPEAFDVRAVGEPDAVGGRTEAGQVHIGLFYVGTASNMTRAIGHAASADGHTFMPFLGGKAVLEPGAPDDRGPAAVLFPDRGVLFFSQERAARTVIAVATTDG
jgi:hypothetical protein